jgi:hypothetical protein
VPSTFEKLPKTLKREQQVSNKAKLQKREHKPAPVSEESLQLEAEIDRLIAELQPASVKELLNKATGFRTRHFWGTSRLGSAIGYSDVRRILTAPFFHRVNRETTKFTFKYERRLMGMKMMIDTEVLKATGLIHPKGNQVLFVRRIFDDWTKKRNGKATEIVEYRRYVNNDAENPLAELRQMVVAGLNLIERRAICPKCRAYARYKVNVGFTCAKCDIVVDNSYERWMKNKQKNNHF